MVGTFKFYTSEWLTGGIHLVILVFAFVADSRAAWPYALGAMSIISFFAWIASYRRYRQIHDLPTSRIVSAAQGYVELFGRSELISGVPVVSKLTGLPCCWYRYYVERKASNDKWTYEDSGISDEDFLLIDDTGQCVVSPDGAEVLPARKKTWDTDERRYTEWLMLPRDMLYALGEFTTVGGAVMEFNENQDVSDLLADWKQKRQQLLERFDLNRDGTLNLKEWELARLQAKREVRERYRDMRSRDGVNVLRRPRDGRLFLLANEMPDKLGRRFAFWSVLHLVVFFGAGSASLMMFR